MEKPSKTSALWCLLSSVTGQSLNGLTFSETRAAVSALADTRVDWLVWREGWTKWKPLVQVRELLEPIHREMKQNPPAYEIQMDDVEKQVRDIFSSETDEWTQSTVDYQTATKDLETLGHEFQNRLHKRLKKRFKVQIVQSSNKFTSHTIDVSVGGILIEDVLPDWVVGYCQVFLIRPSNKKAIEITCFLVENQAPHDRRRLQILPLKDESAEQQLEEWLAA